MSTLLTNYLLEKTGFFDDRLRDLSSPLEFNELVSQEKDRMRFQCLFPNLINAAALYFGISPKTGCNIPGAIGTADLTLTCKNSYDCLRGSNHSLQVLNAYKTDETFRKYIKECYGSQKLNLAALLHLHADYSKTQPSNQKMA